MTFSITVISADDAPAPSTAETRAPKNQPVFDALDRAGVDEVLRIDPSPQSIRGFKVGIKRVANSRGLNVRTWDDGTVVYVQQVAAEGEAEVEAPSPRRSGRRKNQPAAE